MTFRQALTISLVISLVLLCGAEDLSIPDNVPSLRTRSPTKIRSIRRLRHALEKLTRRHPCIARVCKLSAALSKARRCRYNGLSFSEYRKLRDICKNRSEQADMIAKLRRKCRGHCSRRESKQLEKLRKERVSTLQACRAIGWKGGKDCKNVRSLKEKLDRARDECRRTAGRDLLKALEIKKQIEILENLKPSVMPRSA